MSCISLERLPLDLRDRLLSSLPDFLSLRSAVLASQQLHEAYLIRKRTILRAVVLNEVGPALPFAVALVRTKGAINKMRLEVIMDGLNNSDPQSTYWKVDAKPGEAYELTRVSSVVRRLESHFSNRHKDRTAPSTVLTELESYHFHRAMYRIWTLSILANDRYKRSKRTGIDIDFLKKLSDKEFVEMFEASRFLDVIYHAIFVGANYHGADTISERPLNVGLDTLLGSFDNQIINEDIIDMRTRNSVIPTTFNALRLKRNIQQLFEKKFGSQSILEQPRVEVIQACQMCKNPSQLLFGENNWHWLHGVFNNFDLVNFLPGHLSGNPSIKSILLSKLFRPHSYVPMMIEMFDGQNDPKSGWAKNDWLCVDCLKTFFKECLFSWLVNQLIKDGYVFKTNCWYGWNCRTQTHKPLHADKLNHLCEPTSRDDSHNANTLH